jgi:preprotein translocase subunit SecA
VTALLAHVVVEQDPQQAVEPPPLPPMIASHAAPERLVGGGDVALAERPAAAAQPFRAEEIDLARPETWTATPRNAACPCGSGRKYKYCHGAVR